MPYKDVERKENGNGCIDRRDWLAVGNCAALKQRKTRRDPKSPGMSKSELGFSSRWSLGVP